jgi:hypothetical protein
MKKKFIYLEVDEHNANFNDFFQDIKEEIGHSVRAIAIHETKEALIEELNEEEKKNEN